MTPRASFLHAEFVGHPAEVEVLQRLSGRVAGDGIPARHLVVRLESGFELGSIDSLAVARTTVEWFEQSLGKGVPLAGDAFTGVEGPEHVEASGPESLQIGDCCL